METALDQEIMVVLDKYNRAIEEKDIDSFSEIIAHDDDMIWYGTDVWEKWVGWRSAVNSHRAQMSVYSDFHASFKALSIHVSGHIAWAAGDMHFDLIDSSGRRVVIDTRMTAVLEKREGKWVIVHRHASVGAATPVAKY